MKNILCWSKYFNLKYKNYLKFNLFIWYQDSFPAATSHDPSEIITLHQYIKYKYIKRENYFLHFYISQNHFFYFVYRLLYI